MSLSLVVAIHFPTVQRVLLLSETRITDLLARRPLPPGQGRLKVVVVDRGMAVGFAGDPDQADQVMAKFWELTPNTRSEVVNHFLTGHLSAQGAADFVVAFSGAQPAVYAVKEGKAEATSLGWIGDESF